MDSLQGKVALVTGGTKGIGRATSLALAKAGASVAINYRSGTVEANALIEAIGPNQAFAIQADAGSVAGAEFMVTQAVQHFGRLDILVKCAGTSPMNDLANTTEPAFDSAIQLNVKGPYFVAQVIYLPPLTVPIALVPANAFSLVESGSADDRRIPHHLFVLKPDLVLLRLPGGPFVLRVQRCDRANDSRASSRPRSQADQCQCCRTRSH
jgi:NAD(P)-dependent dehydrogenase (short-subunit alcohol dehydrogenase family)